jgi:hypothetical protein
MKRSSAILFCSLCLLPLLLRADVATAAEKPKAPPYACVEPSPETLCTAANACGSPTAPCLVDVKRTASSASATPNFPKSKGNQLFCVKAGTTVSWHSSAKENGFLLDFGPTSPFEPAGAIMGGSDRNVSVVAKNAGCYRYSVGACRSGGVAGMCASGEAEIVVTK